MPIQQINSGIVYTEKADAASSRFLPAYLRYIDVGHTGFTWSLVGPPDARMLGDGAGGGFILHEGSDNPTNLPELLFFANGDLSAVIAYE